MKRNMMFQSIICGILFAMTISAVYADEPKIHPQRVVECVKKAVNLIQEKGPEEAFSILSDLKSGFIDKDLYVFTYNMDGKIVQHLRPGLVGKNVMTLKDKEGKCIACDFVRIAREERQGWSQYWWPRPGSGELTIKVSFIMKVPNQEFFVGAGIYDITKKEVETMLSKRK